jgi:hypothetical protein
MLPRMTAQNILGRARRAALVRLPASFNPVATQSRACWARSDFQSWIERCLRFLKNRGRLRANVTEDLTRTPDALGQMILDQANARRSHPRRR